MSFQPHREHVGADGKSHGQWAFEQDASEVAGELRMVGFLTLLTILTYRGFDFIGWEWVYGLLTGMGLDGLIKGLMARGVLKNTYGVKAPWRREKR